MSPKISGIVVATEATDASAEPWVCLFGAELVSTRDEPALGARRTSYALGDGTVELLTPTGPGPVATAVTARGSHLFSALVDVDDPTRLARAPYADHSLTLADGERFFSWDAGDLAGLRVIARERRAREQVGRLDTWYETTWLVPEPEPAVAALAEWLDLDTSNFVRNDDERWAYRGILTLFAPEQLPRFEVVRPVDSSMPMGRFYDRFGAGLYMAFAESTHMAEIVASSPAGALSIEEDEEGPHTLFGLPKGLAGVLLGISRTDYAWNWSRGRVIS